MQVCTVGDTGVAKVECTGVLLCTEGTRELEWKREMRF